MSAAPAVAIANFGRSAEVTDPEELLASCHALTGWAEALVAAGAARVTVVQHFGRELGLARGGVDYRFVGGGERETAWLRGDGLVRAVGDAGADVVHVNGCVFPLFVRNLRRALPGATAIAVQDHGGSGIDRQAPGLRSLPWRRLHRFGLRSADGFLFTARALSLPWLRAGIIDDGQVVCEIPEASTTLAPPAAASEARLHGRPAVLWVGRLDANKDPLTCLAGFEAAAASLPEAELTMAYGDDALLPELQARIDASPVLRARVHLRGALERRALAALYAAADLFVLCSRREVASFALIEALSFGVTPVVTDIPAFRALTGDGAVGALFPAGDVAGLARALVQTAPNAGGAARARVREHFTRTLDWPAIGGRALAIYRALRARRP